MPRSSTERFSSLDASRSISASRRDDEKAQFGKKLERRAWLLERRRGAKLSPPGRRLSPAAPSTSRLVLDPELGHLSESSIGIAPPTRRAGALSGLIGSPEPRDATAVPRGGDTLLLLASPPPSSFPGVRAHADGGEVEETAGCGVGCVQNGPAPDSSPAQAGGSSGSCVYADGSRLRSAIGDMHVLASVARPSAPLLLSPLEVPRRSPLKTPPIPEEIRSASPPRDRISPLELLSFDRFAEVRRSPIGSVRARELCASETTERHWERRRLPSAWSESDRRLRIVVRRPRWPPV